MRRVALVALLCCVVIPEVSGPEAQAQVPSCGSVSVRNDIYQEGNELYVGVDGNTMREITPCAIEVQTEIWVEGVGGAGSNRGLYSSLLYIGRPVPKTGPWVSKGKHWLIWNGGAYWEQYDASRDDVNVEIRSEEPPSGDDPPEEEEDCSVTGTCEDETGCGGYWESCSPIVVDVLNNGFKLTSAKDGVLFDLDADGTPEQVAWTAPFGDDAWLAMDRNGNGRIDSGAELFGNLTPAYADEPDGPRAANGFVALLFTEGPSYGRSVADRVIDVKDAIFPRLLLWRDANHNGISEADELTAAAAAGLVSIDTAYKEARRTDRYGNEFRQRAIARWVNAEQHVYDVWLKRQ